MKNPKIAGSNIIDCRPQIKKCPIDCNQCWYNNMPEEYRKQPIIPNVEEAKGKIVRVNAEHDSNLEKNFVIQTALIYPDSFFNTSLPNVDFPRPVVLTVNSREEDDPRRWIAVTEFLTKEISNIMFVRYRVSIKNWKHVGEELGWWLQYDVPVVLTFMRYYEEPPHSFDMLGAYEKRKHILHTCWMLRPSIAFGILQKLKRGRHLTACGVQHSDYCRDCRNCEHYYWITKRHMQVIGTWKDAEGPEKNDKKAT